SQSRRGAPRPARARLGLVARGSAADTRGLTVVRGAAGGFVLVVGRAALLDPIGVRCPGAEVDQFASLRTEWPPFVLGTVDGLPLADRTVDRDAHRTTTRSEIAERKPEIDRSV